jgi:polar amino acid transport system substrate-binding protein
MNPAAKVLFSLALLDTVAFASATEIRFCANESSSFYYYNKAGTEKSETPGLLIDFINDVEKKFSIPVKIIRRTRRACRTMIETNEVDAYGPVAYEVSRDKGWAYPPLKGGVPDPQYAFSMSGYNLFYNQGGPFRWDGERISDLSKFTIGGIEGIQVQTFKTIPAMLKRLQNKELDAIAAHDNQVDHMIGKLGIQKHEKTLYMRGYFLVFSDKFYSSNKELAEKIWKFSSEFINTPEGQKARKKYEGLEGF